jgi:MFS family permease
MNLTKILSPIASLIFFVISSGYFTTFISLRMADLGIDGSIIGYIHSAFYAGYLLGSAKVEKFIRRVGHIRSFAAFSGLNLLALMLQGIFTEWHLWVILRFLSGISMASLYVVIESWLIAKSTPKTRGSILGVYMLALYMAQSFSQLFIRWIDTMSQNPFFFSGLFSAIAIIPLALTRTVAPTVEEPSLGRIRALFEKSRLAFWGCFSAGLMLSVIYSFLPIYAQKIKISPSTIMGLTIAGGFVLQWPIGKLSDIFNRARVLVIVALLIPVPAVLIIVTHGYLENFTLVMFCIFGGLTFTIYPMSISQMCDYISERDIHHAVGQLSLVYGLGAVCGPLIVPFFIGYFGIYAIFIYISIVALITFLFGCVSVYYNPSKPMSGQQNYVSIMPKGSPVVAELDPRTED